MLNVQAKQGSGQSYFIGIDVGTQGARVVLVDAGGEIVAKAEETFPLNDRWREEQSPVMWWDVCLRLLKHLVSDVHRQVFLGDVKAIGVTSTSGTVIPLDADLSPLHDAIMYSDPRSAEEGKLCREMALQFQGHGYTGFNSSSGLSKIVWFVRKHPARAGRLSKWVHACDYITGRLCGVWGVTDPTNALKTGYDLKRELWPPYLFDELGLRREWFPKVVGSGTPVGSIAPHVAAASGLPAGIQVVAGMTDGCASQIASGAIKPGDWNTTIGTTLVIKGVTENELVDPFDRLYNHRHPDGFWMPGDAANIGADWITGEYASDLAEMNEQAARLFPTGHIAYPLRSAGERFPFVSPAARGFQPSGLPRADLFTANLEGVAYVERYAFEMIGSLSGEKARAVYSAGGGSKSDAWLNIRSNVLGLPVYKVKHVSGAVGAAILAASRTHFQSLVDATQAMTVIERKILPEGPLVKIYDNMYAKFVAVLQEKGYI